MLTPRWQGLPPMLTPLSRALKLFAECALSWALKLFAACALSWALKLFAGCALSWVDWALKLFAGCALSWVAWALKLFAGCALSWAAWALKLLAGCALSWALKLLAGCALFLGIWSCLLGVPFLELWSCLLGVLCWATCSSVGTWLLASNLPCSLAPLFNGCNSKRAYLLGDKQLTCNRSVGKPWSCSWPHNRHLAHRPTALKVCLVFSGNARPPFCALRLCSATCGSCGVFWWLCWVVWRPCWDYVGRLRAKLLQIFKARFFPLKEIPDCNKHMMYMCIIVQTNTP